MSNEKAPRSDWVYPSNVYTSRDGAPASSSQAPPPQQGYYPPPPDYGYAVTHPGGQPPNDYKQPQTVLAPPTDPYGTPAASSSSAAPAQDEHVSLGSFFGPKGNPPSWNRQPPRQLPYNPFPPMRLISNGDELSKGFPELPPPCALSPHPFATHDVTEEDWKRFLADVKKAGSLSPKQRIKSNVIPMVTGMSFFTGFMATMAIERKMKYRNRGATGDLVDHWNHYFFGPRRIEVVLSQASQRLSGKVGSLDDGRRDSSEDSSSEEERGHGRGDRHTRRADRRARRSARRAEKAERREWKASGDNKQPYELVVTSI